MEEKNGMVKLIVTMEEELLRRVAAPLQPDLGTEGIANVEKGLNFITNNEPGELSNKIGCGTLQECKTALISQFLTPFLVRMVVYNCQGS